MYVCMYVCMYAFMYACMYECMCVQVLYRTFDCVQDRVVDFGDFFQTSS